MVFKTLLQANMGYPVFNKLSTRSISNYYNYFIIKSQNIVLLFHSVNYQSFTLLAVE